MSKGAETFNLNIKTGTGTGTTFTVPDHLTTDKMMIQTTGTFTETVNIQGSLDGTNFQDLTGASNLWWLVDINGKFTVPAMDQFKGGDLTHLRSNATVTTAQGMVITLLLERRDRAFPYTRP